MFQVCVVEEIKDHLVSQDDVPSDCLQYYIDGDHRMMSDLLLAMLNRSNFGLFPNMVLFQDSTFIIVVIFSISLKIVTIIANTQVNK